MRNLFIGRPRSFPIVPPRRAAGSCGGDCEHCTACARGPYVPPLSRAERVMLVAVFAASGGAAGTLVWFLVSAAWEALHA